MCVCVCVCVCLSVCVYVCVCVCITLLLKLIMYTSLNMLSFALFGQFNLSIGSRCSWFKWYMVS